MGDSLKLPIIQISKELEYEKWIKFRDSGLGGSEVPSIMGMNQWKSAHEVYYQKIGVFSQKTTENIPMFMGNRSEALVADLYEYHEGSPESMIENFNKGKKVRSLYEPKGYIINPDYPHLFFSPDRLSLKDQHAGKKYIMKKGLIYTENIEEIIEIKTISGWAAKQYEDEFNPAYGIQLQCYLLGLQIEKGVIVTMKDGREMTEQIIRYDEELVDMILRQTSDFWERVLAGREAVAKGGDYEQFAPPADGSRAYTEFLKKRYANPEDEIAYCDNIELYSDAIEYQKLDAEIKELERLQNERRNRLCEYMGDTYSQIDFGPQKGKVTWRQNKAGTRTFRNLVRNI